MSADARVKSLIDRVLRLKEEQDTIAADIREIYAEAKSQGYNKTAMGEVVAYLRKIEKKGRAALDEKQADFDLYLEAYERATGTRIATHTHEIIPNSRDPHFLAADDGQPRTTSTDACGAKCDGLPPVAGHGGEKPKHAHAESEQSVTHSNTTLATSPDASRKAGEGVLLPLSPAANPDDDVPDFLKRGAA